MKKNSLLSVSLALLTFLGVFQFQNLSKILEDNYNVEQIKTWLKYKDLQRIKAERIMRGLLSTVS